MEEQKPDQAEGGGSKLPATAPSSIGATILFSIVLIGLGIAALYF
jgi:hypothetical protein